jgi:hypothetical protein
MFDIAVFPILHVAGLETFRDCIFSLDEEHILLVRLWLDWTCRDALMDNSSSRDKINIMYLNSSRTARISKKISNSRGTSQQLSAGMLATRRH